MTSRALSSACFGLLSCAAFGVASGQPPPATVVPPPPPRYEVEILVFAHRDFDPNEERFERTPLALPRDPSDSLLAAPIFGDTLFDPLAPTSVDEPPPVQEPPPFQEPLPAEKLPQGGEPAPVVEEDPLLVRPLRADEFKLNNEYRKLGVLGAYQPLLHAGWVQPGLPESQAQPFDLATLGVLNPRGTVRVHLSRFLHITLDLTYTRMGTDARYEPLRQEALSELPIAPRYRLSTTRSARSGELHYFDHPAFGVLVRITPVPEASSQPARRPAA